MDLRIREFRKRRGLTLQELANRIGTTPQTVQRLETAHMTVSTDWLERFAAAFEVHPAQLIAGSPDKQIPVVGRIGSRALGQLGLADDTPLALDAPGLNPVAVWLDEATGAYPAGSLMIGDRLSEEDLANAHGRDCLVATDGAALMLRRVILTAGLSIGLVPLTPSADVNMDAQVDWIAPLIMTVRYL